MLKKDKHMNPILKTTLELGPLGLFFVDFRIYGDLTIATGILVYATFLSLSVTYLLEKKLAVMPVISGSAMVVFGALTVYLNNDYFIKIKPTIVNAIFAALLLGGLAMGKSLLKYALENAMPMSDEGWRQLSLRWGLFFLFLAALNEVIWRNFPVSFWVDFKVFGVLSLTMVFTLAQIPLVKKYLVE